MVLKDKVLMNNTVVPINRNRREEKNQRSEPMHKYTVTHTRPELTPEEREEVKRDILLKMYKNLFNENKNIDTKVKS